MRWIGHGGLAAHRPAGAPVAADLERALLLDLDFLEVDVAATADAAVVLVHDQCLPSGRHLGAVSLADARAELDGLLQLEEAVEATRRAVPLLLDLKPGVLPAVVERLRHLAVGDGEVAVCTEDPVALAVLGDCLPQVARWRTLPQVGGGPGEGRRRVLAALRRRRLVVAAPALAAEVGAAGLCVDHWAVTPRLCAAAHAAGVPVAAWTVNTVPQARRLAGCGVDLLTSDRVEVLRAAGV